MALSPSGLWVEGQGIQSGAEVLSGPFHMTAAADQVIPAKSCHASVCHIQAPSSESILLSISQVLSQSTPQPLLLNVNRSKQTLKQNIILGHFRPMQKKTLKVMKKLQRIQQLTSG